LKWAAGHEIQVNDDGLLSIDLDGTAKVGAVADALEAALRANPRVRDLRSPPAASQVELMLQGPGWESLYTTST